MCGLETLEWLQEWQRGGRALLNSLLSVSEGTGAAFLILEGLINSGAGEGVSGGRAGFTAMPTLFWSQQLSITINLTFPNISQSLRFPCCTHVPAGKGLCLAWFSFLQTCGISSNLDCEWLMEHGLGSLQQDTASRLLGQCNTVLHCLHVVSPL